MPRLTGKAIKAWEAGRDLNAELEASIADVQVGKVTSYVAANLPARPKRSSKSPNNVRDC